MKAAEVAERNRCQFCNLAIYKQRGGWRHKVSGLRLCSLNPPLSATPRTQERPRLSVPRAEDPIAGGVAARPPQGGTLKSGPGGGAARAAAGPGIYDEADAWQVLKQQWPDVADAIRSWLELGPRALLVFP